MTAVAVYTAIAGDYPLPPRKDIKCFNGEAIFTRGVLDAKRYKVLHHLYVPEPVSVWVDGNIWLLRNPEEVVTRYLGGSDMALFVHPARKTVWQEFATLRADKGRFRIPYLQAQLAEQEAFYRSAGLPDDAQLYEANFLIRRNNEAVNRLMDAWWAEICRWQWRDQVSLPYVLWKYGNAVKLRPIRDGDIRKHPDFRYVSHY